MDRRWTDGLRVNVNCGIQEQTVVNIIKYNARKHNVNNERIWGKRRLKHGWKDTTIWGKEEDRGHFIQMGANTRMWSANHVIDIQCISTCRPELKSSIRLSKKGDLSLIYKYLTLVMYRWGAAKGPMTCVCKKVFVVWYELKPLNTLY